MTGVKLPNLLGRGERLQVCKNNDPSYSQKISSKVLRVEQYFPQADYTYGTKKSSNFNLSLLKPLRGKLRSSLTGNVYQVWATIFSPGILTPVFQSNAEHPSSGFKQLDRGFLADFAFTSAPHVQHSLQVTVAFLLIHRSSFKLMPHSMKLFGGTSAVSLGLLLLQSEKIQVNFSQHFAVFSPPNCTGFCPNRSQSKILAETHFVR